MPSSHIEKSSLRLVFALAPIPTFGNFFQGLSRTDAIGCFFQDAPCAFASSEGVLFLREDPNRFSTISPGTFHTAQRPYSFESFSMQCEFEKAIAQTGIHISAVWQGLPG